MGCSWLTFLKEETQRPLIYFVFKARFSFAPLGLEMATVGHSRTDGSVIGVCAQSLSCVRLFATPWTVAHQVLLSVQFSQARILKQVAISSSRGSNSCLLHLLY